MTVTALDPVNRFDDVTPFDTNTVELLDTAVVQATQLARQLAAPASASGIWQNTQLDNQSTALQDREWKALNLALAIAGFEQWLGEGATSLSTSHMPLSADSLTCFNLSIGHYRLCLLTVDSLGNDYIELLLSNSARLLEDAIAHLYVIVEVQEEVNQVSILAGLRRDQLLQRIGRARLQQARNSAELLQIPISYFDVIPEQILLYLNCLEPAEVAEAIEQTAREEIFINAALWLRDQLDSAVEQLSWTLLPPLSAAMRPTQSTVDTVLETLAARGINLPAAARGVGGPIAIGPCFYQLYAWVWPVETEGDLEWTLLLLLGPQIGEILPEGIQLKVSDRTDVIAQEVLAQASSEAYLYTQVQGDPQEQFKVSVVLPGGVEIMLPAFGFEVAV